MKPEKKRKQVQPTKEKREEESLSYSVEVRDKEGKVIQRISAPSRSYVEQWNQLLNVQAGAGNQDIRDTQGNEASIGTNVSHFYASAGIGETRWGIRVGKGSTAVAIDDFALETPLGEGTGLDEFEHQLTTWTAPAVVGPTSSFTAQRILLNNSGASISIREIGCYVYKVGGAWGRALGFRDVLPGAVTVPDGGSITVTYTIAVTV